MPALVTSPFKPRKAVGSYWNTTIEKPDQLLQAGNALSASPAASAISAATNAAAGTGGTSTTPAASDWAGGTAPAVSPPTSLTPAQDVNQFDPNISSWQPGGTNYQSRMFESEHWNDPENVAARGNTGLNWWTGLARNNPQSFLNTIREITTPMATVPGAEPHPGGVLQDPNQIVAADLFQRLYGFYPSDFSGFPGGATQWAMDLQENRIPTQQLTPVSLDKSGPVRRLPRIP
jgi:hypothetical protein